MGACCGRGGGEAGQEDEETKKFDKNDPKTNISGGPVKERHCTDPLCVILYIGAWIAFFIVTFIGAKTGNPMKLYSPRDFSGAYCGVDKNWNNGPNLQSWPAGSYTMNVSSTVDVIMKQFICSTAVMQVLTGTAGTGAALLSAADQTDYLCNCCLTPCTKCTGSLSTGGDVTSVNDIQGTIGGRMTDLTNVGNGANLFNPSNLNGQYFTNMWSQATAYFNAACLTSCSIDASSVGSNNRSYTYKPAGDNPLSLPWNTLLTSASTPAAIKTVISSSFTFTALSSSQCPYDPMYCVPFPGITFSSMPANYCGFQMSAAVTNAIGSGASSVYSSLGGASVVANTKKEFGSWLGDFIRSIDTFVIVCALSIVIGIVFMVVLRFTVGICVWLSILILILIFFFGGAVVWVRSFQCAGADILSTGTQAAVAVAVTAQTTAQNAIAGTQAVSEALSGPYDSGYIGVQYRTINGKSCQKWGSSTPQAQAATYTVANYPNSSLQTTVNGVLDYHNFCRNPFSASAANKAATIWCWTTDTTTKWEQCTPIGVIRPNCPNGYAIDNDNMRKAVEICGYIIWACGGIFVLLIIIFSSRIRLAIALNKVAAEFVASQPQILIVPIVQGLLTCLWTGLWVASASYLVSQVPDGYLPTGSYATYAESAGTNTTAGACTNKWPTGSVWRDELSTDCSGAASYLTAKCWKCSTPRYILDIRFFISLFTYFWTNELFIAIGQTVIAGAVGVWFFAPFTSDGGEDAPPTKRTARTLRTSLYNTFRYHIGSLCFGSFIIAVVQLIRAILMYFQKQAEAQKNRVMVIILKVVQCCMWCLEKCLKFLNKNAYIQIALLGKNFCSSAKAAFGLILRNAIRFAMVGMLGGVIHAIGFACIMLSTVSLGYLILRGMHSDISPFLMCVIYFFVGYVVANLFMDVFGLAVDTSLQCFIAAEEMGHTGDFCPGPLKNMMADGGKTSPAEEKKEGKE